MIASVLARTRTGTVRTMPLFDEISTMMDARDDDDCCMVTFVTCAYTDVGRT